MQISKTTIGNRKKSIKWRFDHSIVISSESLPFVSKGLLFYGPNISENSTIFVRMSQASFYAQNGSSKFQRDIVYRKMYPTLILLTYTRTNYNVQVGFYIFKKNNKRITFYNLV